MTESLAIASCIIAFLALVVDERFMCPRIIDHDTLRNCFIDRLVVSDEGILTTLPLLLLI